MNANYRYKPESFFEWIELEEPLQEAHKGNGGGRASDGGF